MRNDINKQVEYRIEDSGVEMERERRQKSDTLRPMTTPLFDPAVLQHFGHTLQEVQANIRQEAEAFGAHLRTRQADWQQVQAGREWSPAQEAEHVMAIGDAASGAIRLLLSDKPLRAMPQISGKLVDGKRQAPEFSLPTTGLPWDELDQRWTAHQTALLALADEIRATPGRTFWHPFLGELDALDWMRSLVGHLRGHRQLLEESKR